MSSCIVIPMFNGLPQISDCLKSLAWAESRDDVRIVVVDSCSTDGSVDVVRNVGYVDLLQVSGSNWWTGATQAGCRYGFEAFAAERVCLLNHDCRLSSTSFDALLGCAERHPQDLVCSVVKTLDGRWLFAGGDVSSLGVLRVRGWGLSRIDSPTESTVMWCGGMGVIVPHGVFCAVSGFDVKRFPHYYADADFCFRVRTTGASIWVCPESMVYNDKSSSGIAIPRRRASLADLKASLTSRKSNLNIRDTTRFYVRHSGVFSPVALFAVYCRHMLSTARRMMRRR